MITYNTLPTGYKHIDGAASERTLKKHPIKWSGKQAPPAIGSEVCVRMNDLGPGLVRGYFVEHGWLGVLVNLTEPPKWWRDQTKDDPAPVAHIFGTELVGG